MNKKGRLHFIGIGGAGMSSLARVFIDLGYDVSGSDIKKSANTRQLAQAGAKVVIGHDASNVKGADTVIVSSAIRDDNPEMKAAKKAGKTILQRAELLAKLMEEKKGIAIAGTHGKTTTTSMAAVMMEAAGLDPTYLIGGELNDIGSGAKYGRGDFVVAEADESDASLLNLRPAYAVITNIEADHLDFYESIEEIKDVFVEFINNLPDNGLAILCIDSPGVVDILPRVSRHYVTYSVTGDADFKATDIQPGRSGSKFTVWQGGKNLGSLEISSPGLHNVSNALAVITIGTAVGVPFDRAAAGVTAFTGVRRRFQKKGVARDVTVVDDYAHHPSEVAATLQAAKTGKWGRVITVFQPHRYSRTSCLHEDFGRVFGDADAVIVTDVYSAGEEPLPGVDGKLIVDSILETEPYKDVAYFPKKSDISDYISGRLSGGDILLTMGAGDIGSLGEEVLEALGENED
ncbi:MAG: UDP-N-acetylmuramate--L-alanine ligase [Actinomycetota bacterium]